MLRKKIQNDENKSDANKTHSTLLKKKLTPEEDERSVIKPLSKTIEQQDVQILDDLNIDSLGDWLVENILTREVINRLKEDLPLVVPNTDSHSTPSQWLDMTIKSYLPKDDILILAKNINLRNKSIEIQKQIIEDIKKENSKLSQQTEKLKESLSFHKNENFKLKNSLAQRVKLETLVEYSFGKYDGEDIIANLLIEASKSDSDNLSAFIIPFAIYSQNIYKLKKYTTNDVNSDIQLYLDEVKALLKSISGVYIPQRKKLLEALAELISTNFKDIKFISPEEYNFVEPSVHNIPSSGGQKVVEGISFAVVQKDTNQTIIYADIKAQ